MCDSFRTLRRGGGRGTRGVALSCADFSPSVVARFHSKYQQADGCWLWRGAKTSAGYGSFGIDCTKHAERTRPAHRVAYVLAHGPIPEGAVVMHACDNPLCVNPAHLSLGTHQDNTLDAIRKGRRPARKRAA